MADADALEAIKKGKEDWHSFRMPTFGVPELSPPDLSHADLSGLDLVGFNLSGVKFNGADLSKAILVDTDLSNAKLNQTNLESAGFGGANLSNANLRGATLKNTRFDGCNVDGCTIERLGLESLVDYGGLTKGQRMKMVIVDDAATLRRSYTGFWQWIHLIALIIFLTPYLWFVGENYAEASFTQPQNGVKLWRALLTYIWNGGENLTEGYKLNLWPFTAFIVAAIYNLLRFFLLWKAKSLELEEQVRGLPANFSFEHHMIWKRFYISMNVLFWFSILSILISIGHFMNQYVQLQ